MDFSNNVMIIMAFLFLTVGLLCLYLIWLFFQRLRIRLKTGNKQEALQQSINNSWLHKLGGGGASKKERSYMMIIVTIIVIFNIIYHFKSKPIDIIAFLDILVNACVVYFLVNIGRLILTNFSKKQHSN